MKTKAVVCALALILSGCVTPKASTLSDETIKNMAIKAQQEAQAKIAEMQVEQQKAFNLLQLDVAKRCTEKGNIPIFTSGNVDCKVAK